MKTFQDYLEQIQEGVFGDIGPFGFSGKDLGDVADYIPDNNKAKKQLDKINGLDTSKIEFIRKSRFDELDGDYVRIEYPINRREKFHNDDTIGLEFKDQKEREWFYKNLKHKNKVEEYTP